MFRGHKGWFEVFVCECVFVYALYVALYYVNLAIYSHMYFYLWNLGTSFLHDFSKISEISEISEIKKLKVLVNQNW